jgi:molybdopterin-guanine dinucleotide biosynthesis protein A
LNFEPTTGGIILCGGKSSRMGMPKATLPFGPELMLQRVVRLLGEVVSPIVVVAAPGQELPHLPNALTPGPSPTRGEGRIIVVRDEREGRGPLEGLLAGLTAIAPHAEAAYATSCDVPLLVSDFVRGMIARLKDNDAAVPVEAGFAHPLAAVYRTSVLSHIAELLAADRLRPAFLFERVRTARVPVEELKEVDPSLTTLMNLNRPEDYLAALVQAGFTPDPAVLAALETPRTA